MKRSFKLATALILLLIISRVPVDAESIGLISDRYWRLTLEQELQQNTFYRLKQKAEELIPFWKSSYISVGGERIRVYSAASEEGDAGFNAISDLITKSDEEIFLLSPLISYMTCSLAELFPDRVIIGFGNTPLEKCTAANAGMMVYSFSEAYFEAGGWAALNNMDTKTLFYTGSSIYRNNMEAFVNGWNSIETDAALTVSDYNDIEDTSFIDSYRMQFGNGDAVAAVFAGPHNQTVLESINEADRRIISEHLLLWRNTRYNVIGTVDITPVLLLAGALKYVKMGIYRPEEAIEASFAVLGDQ